MKRVILLITMIMLIAGIASASYISGDVYISENGEARFSVESDREISVSGLSFENNKTEGYTEELVRKENGVWIFALNLGDYQNIVLDIHLPKNLDSVKSIQGVDNIIDFDDRIISLVDSDKKLEFEVAYTLKKGQDYSLFLGVIIAVLAALAVYLTVKILKKKRNIDFILPMINDNEKKIVELLMKKPMRQKEIRKQLNLAKASFSRYMYNLEKKRIILREGEGKNKIVKLK